jgi:hypothetical protein
MHRGHTSVILLAETIQKVNMRITTTIQDQALAFIDACTRSGYSPTKEEVALWLADSSAASGALKFWIIEIKAPANADKAEEELDRIEYFKWISVAKDRLRLTDLGRALLAAAGRAETTEPDVNAVVLDNEDPFAYAKLIGYLTKAGSGLLVDPYFRLDQLITVLNGTTIARVLLSKQHKGSGEDRAALRIALDSPSLPRPIEVRASADSALHDRLVVGEGGEVWTLGASLNSIGNVNTVIIPVPKAGAEAMLLQANQLWEEAELVGPSIGANDSSSERYSKAHVIDKKKSPRAAANASR